MGSAVTDLLTTGGFTSLVDALTSNNVEDIMNPAGVINFKYLPIQISILTLMKIYSRKVPSRYLLRPMRPSRTCWTVKKIHMWLFTIIPMPSSKCSTITLFLRRSEKRILKMRRSSNPCRANSFALTSTVM